VACLRKNRKPYRALLGKPEEKDHVEDLGVDGRTILKRILKKQDRRL
jgi:hypothetical protein